MMKEHKLKELIKRAKVPEENIFMLAHGYSESGEEILQRLLDEQLKEIEGRLQDVYSEYWHKYKLSGESYYEGALDALSSDSPDIMLRASLAIREALAEPEPWTPDDMAYRPGGLSMNTEQGINPRPIGFWNGKETAYFEHELVDGCLPTGDCTIPLYIDPPARKPLTDDELKELWKEHGYKSAMCVKFARAIEKKIRGEYE